MRKLFTSEAVTEGHPDKVCDKIADKILDEALKVDKDSHMAVEATIKDDLVLIYGECNTKAKLNYEKIAKWVLKDIGYKEKYNVVVKVSNQSKEIADKVNQEEVKAGDQGIMFGYACRDTEELMPLPIMLANKICKKLADYRKSGKDYLLPDGKSQVTVEYVDNKPKRVVSVVVATQHKKNVNLDDLRVDIIKNVILKVIPKKYIDKNTEFLVNASGSFVVGGSFGDSGTTGRKIVVDSYGGASPVGGGCFSSKDPSKVDRSAAYYSRYVAKNVVAHKYADICQIEVAYVIGYSKPISVYIETFGTNKKPMEDIYKYVNENFDFRVQNIIDELDLRKPIYYDLASYGHFGRNTTWEKISK
ncbi:MAG: methionine adenosyltransferase [Bacilli bacterium]|nr:methionine adenosyltransferase [Bacilli bacterium]